jgi:hypothetical protein
MMLIITSFIKSNHYGIYPDAVDMSLVEYVAIAFACFWQLSAIHGISCIDKEMSKSVNHE